MSSKAFGGYFVFWLFDQVDCVLAGDLLYLLRGPVAEAEVQSDDDVTPRRRLWGPPHPLRSTRKTSWRV